MGVEQKDHNYSTYKDTYLKYRRVVAEWMLDVCEYFTLHPTTTHAAICYLDRLQPHEKFSRFEWQMIAISCILMASKYNECEDHVPDLSTLEDITQQAISNETVLQYELWALKRMGWKLNARTPICFLCSYLRCGIILDSDRERVRDSFTQPMFVAETSKEVVNSLDSQAGKLAKKIAAACILDASFKRFLASDVAIAIVYVIRSHLLEDAWSSELIKLGLPENPFEGTHFGQILEMLLQKEAAFVEADRPSIHVPVRTSKEDKGANSSPTGVDETDKLGADQPLEDKYSHVTGIGSNGQSDSPGNKENRQPGVNASY